VIGPRTLQGRLALVFGATTVVLAGIVGVVVARVTSDELIDAVDESLATRLSDIDTQLSRLSPEELAGLRRAPRTGVPVGSPEGFYAQVLDASGGIRAWQSLAMSETPILTADELAAGRRERFTLVRPVPTEADSARFLVGPSGTVPGWVIVAGTSLDDAERARDRLRLALALALPVLAAVVAAGGWVLAGAALRPVRRIVDEADAISVSEPDRRLTVPGGAGEEIAVLAERLNALLDRVERAVRRERAFVDDASHELRTPLAIVRGELELARMSTPDGTDAAEAVDSSLEEVERLERLAQNLLVLARVAGRRDGAGEAVDVAAVAGRAVRAIAGRAAARGVVVTVNGTGTVRGDAIEVERALANLVDNAARHARSAVWVTVAPTGESVVVDVVDDGPGFPPDLLPRAFDRFTTGGTGGGAGLGLAIVAAIATAHGGEATAGNGTDGGAWVRLRLPAATATG
jgi:two-component system, OmpR family, sensor kinase